MFCREKKCDIGCFRAERARPSLIGRAQWRGTCAPVADAVGGEHWRAYSEVPRLQQSVGVTKFVDHVHWNII